MLERFWRIQEDFHNMDSETQSKEMMEYADHGMES